MSIAQSELRHPRLLASAGGKGAVCYRCRLLSHVSITIERTTPLNYVVNNAGLCDILSPC